MSPEGALLFRPLYADLRCRLAPYGVRLPPEPAPDPLRAFLRAARTAPHEFTLAAGALLAVAVTAVPDTARTFADLTRWHLDRAPRNRPAELLARGLDALASRASTAVRWARALLTRARL